MDPDEVATLLRGERSSPDRPRASGLTLKESPARAGLSLLRDELS